MASEPIETPTTNLVSRLFDSTQALRAVHGPNGPFRASLSDHCTMVDSFGPEAVSIRRSLPSIGSVNAMLTDELNPWFWPESRSLESLFEHPIRKSLPSLRSSDTKVFPLPSCNCFASALLKLSPSRIRTGLRTADDSGSRSLKRDHHSYFL
jgi:hypothetical protein